MKKIKFLLLIILLYLPLNSFITHTPLTDFSTKDSNTKLEQDLDMLLKWFPGEYDNHQQVYKEAVEDLETTKRHRQTHHIFHEVTLDFIPGRKLYAQQSQHYNLNDIYRQRIYAFEVDEKEQAIRLRIYTPKDPTKLIDVHLNPSLLQNLKEEDFILKPGCDVFWNLEGDSFKGYLKDNECNYYSDRFGKQVFLNETLELRKDALLLEDTATDKEGNAVFGVHDKGPTINLKEKSCK